MIMIIIIVIRLVIHLWQHKYGWKKQVTKYVSGWQSCLYRPCFTGHEWAYAKQVKRTLRVMAYRSVNNEVVVHFQSAYR